LTGTCSGAGKHAGYKDSSAPVSKMFTHSVGAALGATMQNA